MNSGNELLAVTKRLVLCLTPLLCVAPFVTASDDLKPYAPAEKGFVRMVFRVPPAENETERMVEIMVGKVLSVDCNQNWFMGKLDMDSVQGWGYPYFKVEQVSGPATTLMACPEDDEKKDAFVQVQGEGFKRRYNSKLPVVVYVPEGFEVRYRIWQAAAEIQHATQE